MTNNEYDDIDDDDDNDVSEGGDGNIILAHHTSMDLDIFKPTSIQIFNFRLNSHLLNFHLKINN